MAQTLTVSALTFVQLSCGEGLAPADEPGNQSNGRITITNDETQLDVRVRYLDVDVPDGITFDYEKRNNGSTLQRYDLRTFYRW